MIVGDTVKITANSKNKIIFDDNIKANNFNMMYCHPTLDEHDLVYKPLDDLDLKNIPNVDLGIYPKNDVKLADYIKNDRLHDDKWQQQHDRDQRICIKTA